MPAVGFVERWRPSVDPDRGSGCSGVGAGLPAASEAEVRTAADLDAQITLLREENRRLEELLHTRTEAWRELLHQLSLAQDEIGALLEKPSGGRVEPLTDADWLNLAGDIGMKRADDRESGA